MAPFASRHGTLFDPPPSVLRAHTTQRSIQSYGFMTRGGDPQRSCADTAGARMRPAMVLPADASPETPPKRKPLFRHPFRRKTLKPRTGAMYIAGAAALLAARPEAALFFPGLAMIAIGQSLRVWATGYLLKTDELTTAGPYALSATPALRRLAADGLRLRAGGRPARRDRRDPDRARLLLRLLPSLQGTRRVGATRRHLRRRVPRLSRRRARDLPAPHAVAPAVRRPRRRPGDSIASSRTTSRPRSSTRCSGSPPSPRSGGSARPQLRGCGRRSRPRPSCRAPPTDSRA